MIRRSAVTNLNTKKYPCAVEIIGICGGKRTSTESINVNMAVDDVVLIVNLFIVDDDILTMDVLLGQDIFKNADVVAEIKNDSFVFSTQVAKVELKHRETDFSEIVSSIDDINVKADLQVLLADNTDVFAENLTDIGLTNATEMKIELTTNVPIAQKPYRVPEPKKHLVTEMIRELLACDIIATSKSEYASPIILVKKKTGGERLCVDYRRLNQHTIKEVYPTPNIEERLSEAMRYKSFSVLDLNSGYYQVPIEEGCRKYTAFITTKGLFEFKRMPFGLRNAPAVFQRLMQNIKDRTRPGDMIHYMDDILVGSNNVTEMYEKLKRVFKALSELNLTLNIKKCEFMKQTIEFLGHKLHSGGISPGTVKTIAVNCFTTPKSITDVRRFLGLSGYFRRFVPGYSIISEPLRLLLRKNQQFQWSEKQEEAFLALKTALTSKPLMTGYRVEADHQIHTDASSVGIAGVLLQREGGDWKPVAYYSRSTTDSERNFHSYELEVLAVVSSLERFRYYVQGKEIVVVTDCSAVTTAMHKRELIPRIARWWLRIQDFLVKLEHRPGRRMEHVDTASLKIGKTTLDVGDWIYSMQHQDKDIRDIVEKLASGDKTTNDEYKIENGRLYRKQKNNKLWVVPKSMRYKIVQSVHEKVKHLSTEKTLEELNKYFWFPRMRNFVKTFLKSCIECAYNKQRGGKIEGVYHYDEIEPVPFKTVHIDHLGPFPRSKKQNEHIIVLVDSFTKFTVLRAVRSTATRHVLTLLNEVSSYFGVPTRIVTDRGTAFTSQDFRQYCNDNDIKQILNAVRTPRANGHAERTNRTLLGMLLPSTEDDKTWDDQLRGIQWALNTTKNKTTQRTPQELLFSYKPRDILQNKLILALHEDDVISNDEMNEIQTEAVSRINQQREKAKQRFNEKHRKPTQYNVGDLVLAENEPVSTGGSRKLEPLYKGPFMVTKVIGHDRYLVEDIPGSKRKQRHYTSIYASDKLKPWCNLPNFDGFDNDVGVEVDSCNQDWPTVRSTA
uniref:RNA-directed DNA polymerase n=1 Tax=Bactrocera dorsalis TaxID=27457 RepID=A0A034WRX5_BACDO